MDDELLEKTIKPKIFIPEIGKIEEMRKRELNIYALDLALSVIENINKTINKSIIKTGEFVAFDLTKSPATVHCNSGGFRQKFVINNKLYDYEYDDISNEKYPEFEKLIKDLSDDETCVVRELLSYYIIGAAAYSLKNNKVPLEEKIKDYYPIQYYLYNRFLTMIFDYLKKGYKLDFQDTDKIEYNCSIIDATNVLRIKVD